MICITKCEKKLSIVWGGMAPCGPPGSATGSLTHACSHRSLLSLLLRSLFLPNCEGSHSVRLLHSNHSWLTFKDTILKDNFLHYICGGVLDNRLDYTVRQKKTTPCIINLIMYRGWIFLPHHVYALYIFYRPSYFHDFFDIYVFEVEEYTAFISFFRMTSEIHVNFRFTENFDLWVFDISPPKVFSRSKNPWPLLLKRPCSDYLKN